MAKILVAFFSATGNTEKIAKAIYEEIDGDKIMLPIGSINNIEPYDLIFVGFPVHSHSVPYQVEKFIKMIPPSKKMALFSTHGSFAGSELARQAIEYAAILSSHVKLLGTFSCRGKVSLQALEILNRAPEHEAWAEMAVTAASHPDEHDIAEAKAFARWIMSIYRHG